MLLSGEKKQNQNQNLSLDSALVPGGLSANEYSLPSKRFTLND
jgi:hypothetical protein